MATQRSKREDPDNSDIDPEGNITQRQTLLLTPSGAFGQVLSNVRCGSVHLHDLLTIFTVFAKA